MNVIIDGSWDSRCCHTAKYMATNVKVHLQINAIQSNGNDLHSIIENHVKSNNTISCLGSEPPLLEVNFVDI